MLQFIRYYTLPLCIIAPLLLGGCATTSDPSKGGLFSYNPEAYEARRQEREARLAAIEEAQRAEAAQSSALEASKEQKSTQLERQQAQLRSLKAQVATMKKRLQQASPKNSEQQTALNTLQQRATKLQSDMQRADATQDVAARKAYLEKLQKEYHMLQQEIDVLLME